jgi:2-polyprenyl-3-methyl-5-hydroxy-6-metoxy-1,4-benzoquinol methylase
MSFETFDREFWERRWTQALREHSNRVAGRRPNTHLLAETADLHPGLALDAGCGHGAETRWLAARGWRVTAVDFSATALDHARATAQSAGADIAERIEWTEADLGIWTPQSGRYDLVICLYVHVAGSVAEERPRAAAGTGVDAVIRAVSNT